MNFSGSLIVQGRARFEIIRNGKVIAKTGWRSNIITSAGKAALAGLAGNVGSITAFSYLAVGTSSTAVSASDTTLTAEIVDTGLARISVTPTRITTTVTNDTLQLTYTWTASGSKTIQEAGILNAASTGILLGHVLTGALSVGNGDILQGTYQVKFS